MNEVLHILLELWKFDLWIYSQWWLYAPLLIPACFYTGFFFLKWTIITAPVWLPFAYIFGAFHEKKSF